MKCPNCTNPESRLIVTRTYRAPGNVLVQARECKRCLYSKAFIVHAAPGDASAWALAKRLQAEQPPEA